MFAFLRLLRRCLSKVYNSAWEDRKFFTVSHTFIHLSEKGLGPDCSRLIWNQPIFERSYTYIFRNEFKRTFLSQEQRTLSSGKQGTQCSRPCRHSYRLSPPANPHNPSRRLSWQESSHIELSIDQGPRARIFWYSLFGETQEKLSNLCSEGWSSFFPPFFYTQSKLIILKILVPPPHRSFQSARYGSRDILTKWQVKRRLWENWSVILMLSNFFQVFQTPDSFSWS